MSAAEVPRHRTSALVSVKVTELFIQLATYAGVARAFESYQVATEVFADSG
jgi:hypothetical protein